MSIHVTQPLGLILLLVLPLTVWAVWSSPAAPLLGWVAWYNGGSSYTAFSKGATL